MSIIKIREKIQEKKIERINEMVRVIKRDIQKNAFANPKNEETWIAYTPYLKNDADRIEIVIQLRNEYYFVEPHKFSFVRPLNEEELKLEGYWDEKSLSS